MLRTNTSGHSLKGTIHWWEKGILGFGTGLRMGYGGFHTLAQKQKYLTWLADQCKQRVEFVDNHSQVEYFWPTNQAYWPQLSIPPLVPILLESPVD